MGLHAPPTQGNVGAVDDPQPLLKSSPEEERNAMWREFDGLSEESVRSRIELKQYDDRKSEAARDWLSQRVNGGNAPHVPGSHRAAVALPVS